MNKKCILCSKVSDKFPHLSYHAFPANANRRNLWLSIIGIDPTTVKSKNIVLCSDHFESRDIRMTPLERRTLVPDATPKFLEPKFRELHDDHTYFSSKCVHTIPDSPSDPLKIKEEPQEEAPIEEDPLIKKELQIKEEPQDNMHSHIASATGRKIFIFKVGDTGAGPSGLSNLHQIKKEPDYEIKKEPDYEDAEYDNLIESAEKYLASKNGTSSKSTSQEIKTEECINSSSATSSEEEIDFGHGPRPPRLPTRKKRKIYLGDLTVEDFSEPSKIIKNLEIIRTRDAKMRKEKHKLQMIIRRLKLRIKKLSSIIDEVVNSTDVKLKIRRNRTKAAIQ